MAEAAFADVEIEVQIGQRALVFGNKCLARHRQHGIDDSDIGDVAGTHLTIDHFLARGRKIGHWRTLQVERTLPREELKTGAIFGTRSAKTQHDDCAAANCAATSTELRFGTLFDRNGEPADQPRDLVQMSES